MTIEGERAALRALVANVRLVLSQITTATKPTASSTNETGTPPPTTAKQGVGSTK